MLASLGSNTYIITEYSVIFSAYILSLIFCLVAAVLGIRRRFSFPLFLLVVAHPAIWLEGPERSKSSIVFALCALLLLLIPQFLPSENIDDQNEKKS